MLKKAVLFFILVTVGACSEAPPEDVDWQPVTGRLERDQLLATLDGEVAGNFLQKAYAERPLKLLAFRQDLNFDEVPELFLRLEHPEVCQKTLCPMAMLRPTDDGYEISNFFHGHNLTISERHNDHLTFVVEAYQGHRDVFRWVLGEYGYGYSADVQEVTE